MNNKNEYRETKLGVIPKDWDVIEIEKTRDPKDRYSFTGGPFGSDLKSEHYAEEGVRVLQLQNIGDGVFLDDYRIYTSESKADELISCNIYPGEIIISKMAEPLARACIIPDFDNRYLMCSDGIRLKVDVTKYDRNYIFYTINSSNFRNNAIKHGNGTTRLRIGLSELKNLQIPLPPLPEQQKIAEILSTWDNSIENLENLISKKIEIKKGLMQNLLTGNVRFPGFEDEWKDVKLEDICSITTGKLNANAMQDGGKYKFFTCAREVFQINTPAFDTEALLVSGNGANVGYIHYYCGKFNAYQRTYVLDDFTENILFVKFLLECYLPNRINREKNAGNTPYIVLNTLSKMKLRIPSIPEQQKIASVLSTQDKEIDLLKQKLELVKTQKKGLMQNLLTGKVRVNV